MDEKIDIVLKINSITIQEYFSICKEINCPHTISHDAKYYLCKQKIIRNILITFYLSMCASFLTKIVIILEL